MMRKWIKIVSIFVLPSILVIIIGFYVLIFKIDKLPYKNYSDFSTGCGYIYASVKFHDSTILTVMPNEWFYESLRHYEHNNKYNIFRYIFKISLSNFLNIPIKVNKKLFEICKCSKVDYGLVSKYEKIDILKSDLIKGDLLNDSLNREDRYALVYILLKNRIKNCSNDCISGYIIISDP